MTERNIKERPFALRVFDCAGLFDEIYAPTFDVLMCLADWAKRNPGYKGKALRFYNDDNCDVDSNGLTEEQNDTIDEVLS
jgi:hypothetical protein